MNSEKNYLTGEKNQLEKKIRENKIYLVGNWKDAFTLGDDALAASEFERLEASEAEAAVGLVDALEKSGMIVF